MRELGVFINNSNVGALSEENQKYAFSYDVKAQSVVSVTMPIRRESWVDTRVHPIFQMNLPEGALKEAIANSFGKYRKMDQMGFLEVIGSHVLGRVKFANSGEDGVIETLEGILFGDTDELFSSLLDKYSIRSGVSGVQPKVLLDAYDKHTMLYGRFIVKSWSKEYPELAANEYFCMNACKRAGLMTPEYRLSENRKLFVIKRFDIKNDTEYYGFEEWWKRKTYENFAKLTCGIKPSKMDEIIDRCINAVKETKIEVAAYAKERVDFVEFGDKLINTWQEEIK